MSFEEMLADLPEPAAGEGVMSRAAIRARLRKPGRILKAARELRQESLELTALRTGIAIGRLHRLETDADRPTSVELQRLAEHLRGDPRVLFEAFGY